jgi:hypothetical protein
LPVANSVFSLVSEIGVRWPKSFAQRLVCFWSRIFVTHKNGYWCAQRPPFEGAGQDFAAIRFLPLCRDLALPRPTPIEFALNVGLGQVDSWWTPLNYDPDTATMRFTEGGDAEKLAKRAAHYAVILDAAENLSIKEDG